MKCWSWIGHCQNPESTRNRAGYRSPHRHHRWHTLRHGHGHPQLYGARASRRPAGRHQRTHGYLFTWIHLYNILALRPPITGSSADAEVMERIKTGRITPPSQRALDPRDTTVLLHCPDHQVPEALSAVAMQALVWSRPSDILMSILQRDVAAYTAGYAPVAEHAGLFRQMRLSLRRHATLAAAWSVIILLVLDSPSTPIMPVKHRNTLWPNINRPHPAAMRWPVN